MIQVVKLYVSPKELIQSIRGDLQHFSRDLCLENPIVDRFWCEMGDEVWVHDDSDQKNQCEVDEFGHIDWVCSNNYWYQMFLRFILFSSYPNDNLDVWRHSSSRTLYQLSYLQIFHQNRRCIIMASSSDEQRSIEI